MIPIRDTTPSKNFPVVTLTLMGINAAVYLLQLGQGQDLNRFVYFYGLVPARYFVPELSSYFTWGQQALSFLTFMFLHGGFLHLLFNMWSLYIFGDNVEDRLGPFRYLAFYLLCGLGSGISHMVLNTGSNDPVIGASGAIAGVMGAYFILYPGSRILTLFLIIIIPLFIEIPAFFFIGIWFVLQFINAAVSHGSGNGIAWWAHIGGFICGILFLKMFIKLPSVGVSRRVQKATVKKRSHRLQMIRPSVKEGETNLYGTIIITQYEAMVGTKKLVNIPWGFKKRLFNVSVPSGMAEGKILKLKGLGKLNPGGGRGDLLLKIKIQPV